VSVCLQDDDRAVAAWTLFLSVAVARYPASKATTNFFFHGNRGEETRFDAAQQQESEK
jgi:hypothetical protein